MESFYSRLSYSLGNEDWETEGKALQTTNESHILCITASGDRPLNLLTRPCAKMTSVDLNPIQNALLDLKVQSIRHFDYEKYLAFMGVTSCKHRKELYVELAQKLDPKSKKIWDREQKKIHKGILYQGVIERWCLNTSRILRFFGRKKIHHLFSCKTIEEQRQFVEKRFCTPLWRNFLLTLCNPRILRFTQKDPGWSFVDPKIHSGPHVLGKIEASMKTHPIHENILLSLLLKGSIDQQSLPPYLREEGYQIIKKNVDRLNFRTANLLDTLESLPEESIDRFSLSDVASYIHYPQFTRMLRGIYRVAKPQARFCIRQFLTRYEIPLALRDCFSRENELEENLEKEDRCFVYSFLVGTISK